MVDIGSSAGMFSAAYRIAFCAQEEKNYDAGAKKLLD